MSDAKGKEVMKDAAAAGSGDAAAEAAKELAEIVEKTNESKYVLQQVIYGGFFGLCGICLFRTGGYAFIQEWGLSLSYLVWSLGSYVTAHGILSVIQTKREMNRFFPTGSSDLEAMKNGDVEAAMKLHAFALKTNLVLANYSKGFSSGIMCAIGGRVFNVSCLFVNLAFYGTGTNTLVPGPTCIGAEGENRQLPAGPGPAFDIACIGDSCALDYGILKACILTPTLTLLAVMGPMMTCSKMDKIFKEKLPSSGAVSPMP